MKLLLLLLLLLLLRERERERKDPPLTLHHSDVSMNWLDSHFPVNADVAKPGVSRGRCDPAAGDPKTVESAHPDASVVYSNIKVRDQTGTPLSSF